MILKINNLKSAIDNLNLVGKSLEVLDKNKIIKKSFLNKNYHNLLLFSTKNNYPEIYFTIENSFYANFLKKSENYKNYEIFYKFIKKYSIFFKKNKNLKKYFNINKKKNKILFFIHNLDSDRAHVEHFLENLKSLKKNQLKKIEIIGLCKKVDLNQSNLFYFCKKNNIKIYTIERKKTYTESVLHLLEFFHYCSYEKIIFLSIPVFFSFFSVFFNNLVLWSMKYSYKSNFFPNSNKIVSFKNSPNYRILNKEKLYIYKKNLNPDIKKLNTFFTIGRLEKIENINFLERVVYLLKKFKNYNFHYAAQKESEVLLNLANKNNFSNRVKYLGWLNLEDKIDYGSIYLDTFELSGMIAAYVVSAGVPIIFFKDSTNWLNDNLDIKKIKKNRNYFKIYKNFILKNNFERLSREIISDSIFRENYTNLLKLIAEENFFKKNKIQSFFDKNFF